MTAGDRHASFGPAVRTRRLLREDLTAGQDGRREVAGEVLPAALLGQSAYELATGIGIPASQLFDPIAQWHRARGFIDNLNLEENWDRLMQEISRLDDEDPTGTLVDNLPPRLQEALHPLSYYHRITRESAEELIKFFKALTRTDFQIDRVRPALGFVGIEQAMRIDTHTMNMFKESKLIPVNQTPWLKSHSGMQEPTEELRQRVYKEIIWERYLKERYLKERYLKETGFGRYR